MSIHATFSRSIESIFAASAINSEARAAVDAERLQQRFPAPPLHQFADLVILGRGNNRAAGRIRHAPQRYA